MRSPVQTSSLPTIATYDVSAYAGYYFKASVTLTTGSAPTKAVFSVYFDDQIEPEWTWDINSADQIHECLPLRLDKVKKLKLSVLGGNLNSCPVWVDPQLSRRKEAPNR